MTDLNPASLVASLYARAQTAIESAPAPATPRPEAAPGFDLAQGAADFVATLRAQESTVARGLTGAADPQSVVMALASTELAVETAVTLRDKVVEAYQEILRMPV